MADERQPRRTLSKNLKQMKFMQRRSEADVRKQLEEERRKAISESHWVIDEEVGQNDRGSIEIEPSYIPCEQLYTNGRMSFKNFNPVVEKAFKEMLSLEADLLSEAREREATVSDEEMARRYDTLVGTIGKKFISKRKRSTTEGDTIDGPSSLDRKKARHFMKPRD
ncbi:predicted protein [Nematostella vectensis]|uniref:M-phase phosphoprotein 6 n=1 Tax=Nematostella vectensis TaxID=45351 RepID=A7SGT0_NEMVE|nr:predicted protein [Nematostella vectensis]|eukprot:XP_001629124.1 predicted protein [Nematostella vectensis]